MFSLSFLNTIDCTITLFQFLTNGITFLSSEFMPLMFQFSTFQHFLLFELFIGHYKSIVVTPPNCLCLLIFSTSKEEF